MAKLKYKKGNILDANENIIAHGCNCHHVMGAGVAYALRSKWPEVYTADLKTKKSSPQKLGSYSIAVVDKHIILNMYTQYNFGGEKPVSYKAIYNCFNKLNNDIKNKNLIGSIAIPKIGAGLAGGNWNMIEFLIENATPDIEEITVYVI